MPPLLQRQYVFRTLNFRVLRTFHCNKAHEKTAVYDEGAKSIALVQDLDHGLFCCGHGDDDFFNGTYCATATHGNASAFVLPPGRAIADRLSASSASPAPGEDDAACTPAAPVSSSVKCATTAVGVGVAVPLGVLLLLAVTWALYLRRQIKCLRQSYSATAQGMANPQVQTLGGDMQKMPEAGGMPVAEIGSEARMPELEARNDR